LTVRVEVTNAGPVADFPVSLPETECARGRGRAIVAALSGSRGADATGGGIVVRCEFAR
jgi:hypothetical protein